MMAARAQKATRHRSAEPEVAVVDRDGGFDLWVLVDGVACSTAQVRRVG